MMATTTAERVGSPSRTRCRECLGSIRRLGEIISTDCRWLWGCLQALGGLDDARESELLEQERRCGRRFIAATLAAMSDRRISPAENARTYALGEEWVHAQDELRAYNEREDERHQEARKSATYARETLAPASRALDRAEALAGPRNGGCETPWADVPS